MRSQLVPALRLYLVTDGRVESVERMVAICDAAIRGGVTAIQLRAKGWSDRQLYAAGACLRSLCQDAGVLFLVNDRIDIALAVDADGVHLGVDDLPVAEARRLLGRDRVIGYSPETPVDREAAESSGASYLGVGPVYATGTKGDAGKPIGLPGISEAVRASTLPIIGIGGITAERALEVLGAGAVGVAVVSDIFLANDPEAAARRLTWAIP